MCLKEIIDMIIETSRRKRVAGYTRALFHFDEDLNDQVLENSWSKNNPLHNYPSIYTANHKFGAGCALCQSSAGSGTYSYLKYNGTITNVLDVSKDFTIDAWVYGSDGNSQWIAAAYETTYDAQNPNIGFFVTESYVGIRYTIEGSLTTFSKAYSPTGWDHFAYVRNGTNNYIFLNGVLFNQNTTSAFDTPNYLRVGECQYGGSESITFFLDECRISNIARWTSDFTPPSAPYTLD